MTEPTIDRLCERVGIALSYRDGQERVHMASDAGKRAVLSALGFDVSSDGGLKAATAHVSKDDRRPVPPYIVTLADEPFQIPIKSPHAWRWTLRTEDGEERGGEAGETLLMPPLPAGYHQLILARGNIRVETTILSAPARCWMPDALIDDARWWGITTQIYGLRSENDPGIGTYVDAAILARAAGERGAAFLGLSPTHALFTADASKYSPYSPSSRLFLQTSLIDVAGNSGSIGSTGSNATLVDYASVLPASNQRLQSAFDASSAHTDPAFLAFRQDGGETLQRHCIFEALSAHFWTLGRRWVGAWPRAFRNPRSRDVATFAAANMRDVLFHGWLQFIADRQLGAVKAAARTAGMDIGLYRDLAVGADRAGSEVWSAQEQFLTTLSIGAPPDPLGPQGQDWGLPPPHPLRLADKGFLAFRRLVASNMRHAGALRIDHAFQLRRLFVMPLGGSARDGVYLDYPFEAMLAVLRIESHRAQCLVVAEDLGTSPAGFSDAIMASGLLSYRLLPFSRDAGGAFTLPQNYPRTALAALATHDLPTFAGWWRGVDIETRECLGSYDAQQARAERERRTTDRGLFKHALGAEALLPAVDGCGAWAHAATRFLARTPSMLVAVQLEDILGETQQANLPGPDAGHPNWRRRYSATVESLAEADTPLNGLAFTFRSEGRDAGRFAASTMPRATYRLQLHKRFGFDDARAILPYLKALGISHVYVSPIQMAEPGSTHGYDVVDATRLNPELGGESAFIEFSDGLRAQGLGLIVDIVPNHMGIGGSSNQWWLDVLEWGRDARHAHVFDVDWDHGNGQLIVPFLGETFDEALDAGKLALRFDRVLGRIAVWYAEHCFPVSPQNYAEILGGVRDAASGELTAILDGFDELALCRDPATVVARADYLKAALSGLCAADAPVEAQIASALETVAADRLKTLIESQAWRLVSWKRGNRDINYRRFFDITSLAGIRMEDIRVFEAHHALIFSLIESRRIQGLRIDHVDGLADPGVYLQRLTDATGPGFPIYIEKILEPGEPLPKWPVSGTTGYDALRLLDNVFLPEASLTALDALYKTIAPGVGDDVFEIKTTLLSNTFPSELSTLWEDVATCLPETLDGGRDALKALLASFPVYRIYESGEDLPRSQQHALAQALEVAAAHLQGAARDNLASIAALLTGPVLDDFRLRAAHRRAQRRFQQLTGPLMAKSVEDTLFYRNARFIAGNEVGSDSGDPVVSIEAFHRANEVRAHRWPASMLATATHDTKRGEDTRARLIAASRDPALWRKLWETFRHAVAVDDGAGLEENDLYFLFQALVGAWPVPVDDVQRLAFIQRAETFVEKALREAKRHSSWTNPNEQYEAAARAVISQAAAADGPLNTTLKSDLADVAQAGARLSLARTILKCTIPGVPDIYQGTELNDFSFVDPDNRRPVDFAIRTAQLQTDCRFTLAKLMSGAMKQCAIALLLQDRRRSPGIYQGAYRPLKMCDDPAFLAFERSDGAERRVVVARRLFSARSDNMHDTSPRLLLEGRWRNLLDGREFSGRTSVAADQLLKVWPAAILEPSNANDTVCVETRTCGGHSGRPGT